MSQAKHLTGSGSDQVCSSAFDGLVAADAYPTVSHLCMLIFFVSDGVGGGRKERKEAQSKKR